MKLYVSMIVPAPNGCNLHCAFCAIAQRGEADINVLSDDDYVRFLRDVARLNTIERFSLQGYEPLLPECWDLTETLLSEADKLNVPSISIVTNGTFLCQRVQQLKSLCDELIVSLDSAEAAIHDKLRGKGGAYKETCEGLQCASPVFGNGLVVNSVMLPHRRSYLESMPSLLAQLGVQDWYITPLADFKTGTYCEAEPARLAEDIDYLATLAVSFGVRCHLCDDIGYFTEQGLGTHVSIARTESGVTVLRLSPDATCSIDDEVLRPSTCAHTWDRGVPAGVFLRTVLGQR